jgi:hypothetical protein
MTILLTLFLVFCFLSVIGDAVLSEIGTNRGISFEGNSLWRTLDGKFCLTHYLMFHVPLLTTILAPSIWILYHPNPWLAVIMSVIAGALGAYHVPATIAWIKLFRR